MIEKLNFIRINPESLANYEDKIDVVVKFWKEFNTENITFYKLVERFKRSNSILLLALNKNSLPLGFAVYTSILTPLENHFRIELYALYVEPSKQKNGIGSSIVDEVISHGKEMGCRSIHVTAGIDKFYEKMDFKKYNSAGRYFKNIQFI